jgi:hypothetical protein
MSFPPRIARGRRSHNKMTPAMRVMAINAMGKTKFSLTQLMSRPKVPMNVGKEIAELDAEARLCMQIADRLRELTLDGSLKAVWCHVPNEGKRNWFTAILLRAIGMLPGAFDYWFIWEGGGGIIEIKVDGDLNENQEYFETWALSKNVNKAVARSVEKVIDILTRWGAIENPADGRQGIN